MKNTPPDTLEEPSDEDVVIWELRDTGSYRVTRWLEERNLIGYFGDTYRQSWRSSTPCSTPSASDSLSLPNPALCRSA